NFSIADYNLSAIREMDAFRAITESVYGEEGLIGIILNKLGNGEPLTDLERNNLYDYFQNEILDDTKYYHLRNKHLHLIAPSSSGKPVLRLKVMLLLNELNL